MRRIAGPRRSRVRSLWLGPGLLWLALAGCARPGRLAVPELPPDNLPAAEIDARADAVRRDPRAYLHQVLERCRGLSCYTLTFTRWERRGLFDVLYGPERIACWFRREPFSVRLKWLDEELKYDETVYVAGQADDRVRFVTRWWCPPLLPPPYVNRVLLQTPVIWGESKRPLTDFGLERLMERTCAALEQSGQEVLIRYERPQRLKADGPPLHHLRVEHDPARYPVPVQDLYIDLRTDLPAGTVLRRSSGDVDAAYFYDELRTDVRLSDADFQLAAEKSARDDPAP